MAEKTTKKTTAKKTVAKKPAAKPAVAKKPVAKKAPAKKPVAKKPVAKPVAPVAPVIEKHDCGCGHDCACGSACACGKKKCTFGRFFKKLILIMIIFALGFVAAKMCCDGHRRPRPVFENGCLVVKCPKLAQMAPMMDVDGDGCITKAEFKAARKQFKAQKHQPAQPVEPVADEAVVAPAPQLAE